MDDANIPPALKTNLIDAVARIIANIGFATKSIIFNLTFVTQISLVMLNVALTSSVK